MQGHEHALLSPPRLYGREEVLTRPTPVPPRPGVYAWYFREVPSGVPFEGCHTQDDLSLLYVGISPKKPPSNSKPPSKQSLATRIRYHFAGNAEGSTLRLTLGCLLADQLGIKLTRVGSGNRYTFTNPGEMKLDAWLDQNARVCWVEHPRPWELEEASQDDVVAAEHRWQRSPPIHRHASLTPPGSKVCGDGRGLLTRQWWPKTARW